MKTDFKTTIWRILKRLKYKENIAEKDLYLENKVTHPHLYKHPLRVHFMRESGFFCSRNMKQIQTKSGICICGIFFSSEIENFKSSHFWCLLLFFFFKFYGYLPTLVQKHSRFFNFFFFFCSIFKQILQFCSQISNIIIFFVWIWSFFFC